MSRRYGPFDPFDRQPPFNAQEIRIPRPPRRFWVGLGFIAAAFLFVLVANPLLSVVTEAQWFTALGLGDVFGTRLRLQLGLFLGAFAAAFVFAAVNVALALRSRAIGPLRRVGITRRWLRSPAGGIGMAAAAGIALILSAGVTTRWQDLALFLHYSPAGVTEPVFGQDVSFYLLRLPLLGDFTGWALGLVFLTGLATGLIYTWRGDSFDFNLPGVGIAHLSVLLALLALVLAGSTWLGRFDTLYSHSGVVFGAGYADVNARIPLATGRAAAGVLIAGGLLANAWLRRLWLPVVAVGAWVVLAIAGALYPAFVQGVFVKPAEAQRERPYIQREIDFTRRAYGLDQVTVQPYIGDAPLTAQDIASDQVTVDNLRLWDYGQLLDVYSQLQTIRTYYQFAGDIDIDRYRVDGRLVQTELGARELSVDRLPAQARTWQNEKLIYTHGYGVAISPVSAADQQGLPQYLTKDIPPSGPIKVDRPQIYFGELTHDYALAPSATPEFDHPGDNGNVMVSYTGTHGVRMGGLNRALWSLRTGDFNLLVSPQVQDRSQMLYRRNIKERASAIAPFLDYDSDPYLVVADGRLYWIIDAYTDASTYPYSQQSKSGVNYIRNSVKVVIDAYEGTADFYVADPQDPLLRAYRATFPTLFKPLDRMPASLQAHLRVPERLFSIQSEIFSTYHVTDPGVLYNREDVWDLPNEQRGPQTQPQPLPPYYVLVRLPGEKTAEYLLIQPFTPRGKTNLVGWLAARNDPPHYGQFIAFEMPRDRVIVGPQQVSAFINQKQEISRDQTLLNQQGSQYILGNLLVVPIGDTFLYFQPVYLRSAAATSVPELYRVILAHGDVVAYATSVKDGLDQLVGGNVPAPPAPGQPPPPSPPPGASATVQQLAQQALQHYNAAQADLRSGDLAGYASEMNQVGALLQQIASLTGASPSPSPTPSGSPGASPRPSPTR